MKIMRRLIVVLLTVVILIATTGCYQDTRKNNMALNEVKVYDEMGNEVVGRYVDYYREMDAYFTNMNSAAPVVNYYLIDVTDGMSLDIHFIFNSKNKKTMKELKIELADKLGYGSTSEKVILKDITNEADEIIVKYHLEIVSSTMPLITVISWLDDKDVSYNFGEKGGNVYVKGVFLKTPAISKKTSHTKF